MLSYYKVYLWSYMSFYCHSFKVYFLTFHVSQPGSGWAYAYTMKFNENSSTDEDIFYRMIQY